MNDIVERLVGLIQTIVWIFVHHSILEDIPRQWEVSRLTGAKIHNMTEINVSNARLKPPSNSYVNDAFPVWEDHDNVELVNATILVLCRNWELKDILSSMRSLEDRFNRHYHYPWTFLNDEEFTQEFKEWTSAMASGKTEYGLVRPEDWNTPDFIDEDLYQQCLNDYNSQGVLYGWSRSYRNMCHYNSGYFFRQELTLKYDYYFRVEPGVEYYCDFQMDPFKLMRDGNKKYGFVVSLYEYPNTIPTLYENVKDFMALHPEHIHPNSAINFITNQEPVGLRSIVIDEPGAEEYNMCHFWSNFEIGDLNFFRSQAYLDLFDHLSKTGGFYYERWGDAPVHSIAVSLLLDRDEVYHFEDLGYFHVPFRTFPTSKSVLMNKRCILPKSEDEKMLDNINISPHGCLGRWWKFGSGKRFIKDYFYLEDYIVA